MWLFGTEKGQIGHQITQSKPILHDLALITHPEEIAFRLD